MYVCMCVCMDVLYIDMQRDLCQHHSGWALSLFVCWIICLYVFIFVSMYLCMFVCMYVCM